MMMMMMAYSWLIYYSLWWVSGADLWTLQLVDWWWWVWTRVKVSPAHPLEHLVPLVGIHTPAIDSHMSIPKRISVPTEVFGLARRHSTIEGNYRGNSQFWLVIDRVAKKLEGASADKSGNKCVCRWGHVKSTRKHVGKQEEESIVDFELHTAHALLTGRNVCL